MATEEKLSERQNSMLDYIWNYIQKHGRPPTIREIGAAVGISSTSVVNYNLNKLRERGYIQRESEVSRGLSLTWKGSSLFEQVEKAVANLLRIPMVGDIVASEPVQLGHDDFSSYSYEDALEISPSLLPGRADDLFALRVRGDSMIDAMINDNDIVIMKRATEARNGDMVAVWLSDKGEMTLKRFFNEGDRVKLQPENKTMSPIYRHPASVQVQGKVVMVLRQMAA